MKRLAIACWALQVAACEPVAAALLPSTPPFPDSTPAGPEAACARACSARAGRCSDVDCARGCNLILDRLAEHEGATVVACVARGPRPCDDRSWSTCAALVGPHADGGPPAPPSADQGQDSE